MKKITSNIFCPDDSLKACNKKRKEPFKRRDLNTSDDSEDEIPVERKVKPGQFFKFFYDEHEEADCSKKTVETADGFKSPHELSPIVSESDFNVIFSSQDENNAEKVFKEHQYVLTSSPQDKKTLTKFVDVDLSSIEPLQKNCSAKAANFLMTKGTLNSDEFAPDTPSEVTLRDRSEAKEAAESKKKPLPSEPKDKSVSAASASETPPLCPLVQMLLHESDDDKEKGNKRSKKQRMVRLYRDSTTDDDDDSVPLDPLLRPEINPYVEKE